MSHYPGNVEFDPEPHPPSYGMDVVTGPVSHHNASGFIATRSVLPDSFRSESSFDERRYLNYCLRIIIISLVGIALSIPQMQEPFWLFTLALSCILLLFSLSVYFLQSFL